MSVQETKSYWGAYASVYDEGVDYVVGRSLRLAIARKLSRERFPGETLECGCGAGFFTKVIARHADRVTATDIAAEMIGIASHGLASVQNVLFRQADAEKTSFPAKSFDSLLLANILNTAKNPQAIVYEAFRVLKYGGLLIAIVYTDYGMDGEEKSDLSLRYFQKFGMPPSWGLRNFSPEEFRRLVRQAGFTVKTVTILGDKPKALYLRAIKAVRMDGLHHPHYAGDGAKHE